jgi:hypothetical protein
MLVELALEVGIELPVADACAQTPQQLEHG